MIRTLGASRISHKLQFARESVVRFGGLGPVGVGVAALGALGTAVYRATLPGLLPHDVPGGPAHQASESIIGAVTAATKVPDGSALLAAARNAFASGFNAVAWAGAAVFAGIAILALATFR